MRDTDKPARVGSLANGRDASIQVICLGSGGGPSEDNVTGLLVRSAAAGWARNSLLAVDAGTHMASITRILERDLPLVSASPLASASVEVKEPIATAPMVTEPICDGQASPISISSTATQEEVVREPIILENGPFAGASLPHASARANAAHIVRSHVSTYLITHPHLDHLSGFAINTAAFHATSRPKTLAALPFTVDAIKKHIFNDVIWPNMTDEDGGVGFVTFQRLKEGGDLMLGEGEGRGYIEVCEGLGVKGFKISHGNCMKSNKSAPSHRPSLGNISDSAPSRMGQEGRTMSISTVLAGDVGPPNYGSFASGGMQSPPHGYIGSGEPQKSVVDSTAYFIRDYATSKELLIFGDVEPDSVSSSPRLSQLWGEAALKIASGVLSGIFIECSYDDSQGDAILFGHMAPRHLVHELSVLARMVRDEKFNRAQEKAARKRKRSANGSVTLGPTLNVQDAMDQKRSKSVVGRSSSMQARRISLPTGTILEQQSGTEYSPTPSPSRMVAVGVPLGPTIEEKPPLKGIKVVIIHVKDALKDGPHVSERILVQLQEHTEVLKENGGGELGCEFAISESGQDYWF
ncbi:hypothetical protein MBLNU459_g3712t1 [Dothideomycetes sp. NU459]